MERWMFLLVLTDLCTALNHSLVTEYSPSGSGVLLLTGPKGEYQFEFSEASEVCLFKNSSIATRSQLQTALDHGLEACRFGWIAEQVAAVPRLSSIATCGGGKTGVVTWRAPLQRPFGVWCFTQSRGTRSSNNRDSNEAEKTTVLGPQTTTMYTTTAFLPRRTVTTNAITTATATTTIHKTSQTTRNPTERPLTTRMAHVTSTSILQIQTSSKPKTPHSESVSTQFTTITTKSRNTLFIASSSTVGSTSSVRSYVSEPDLNSVSPKPSRQRVLSTALIVFCIIVLVLSAGGAVFYYKLSKRWVWPHSPQKDDIETETWKQTCSELELQEEMETEGEGRRSSSETVLYVNPDARTD